MQDVSCASIWHLQSALCVALDIQVTLSQPAGMNIAARNLAAGSRKDNVTAMANFAERPTSYTSHKCRGDPTDTKSH